MYAQWYMYMTVRNCEELNSCVNQTVQAGVALAASKRFRGP